MYIANVYAYIYINILYVISPTHAFILLVFCCIDKGLIGAIPRQTAVAFEYLLLL